MKGIIQIAVAVLLPVLGYGQNNPIFYGGAGDGWSFANYTQASIGIMFNGGPGDGWHNANYSQSSVATMFRGGNGDGWNTSNYSQATITTMFNGGSGDGWNFNNYVQSGITPQFSGGTGDGWNTNNYSQTYNDLAYRGGVGDGWAATYTPVSPLPVSILSFTAIRDKAVSRLQWEMGNDKEAAFFVVERSSDAVHFKRIGSVVASEGAGGRYTYTDQTPLPAYNYYRIFVHNQDGSILYTPARVVYFDISAEQHLMVYPNPATSSVNVELPPVFLEGDMILNVYNGIGAVVVHKRFTDMPNTVFSLDVSGLAAGSFYIHVTSGANSASAKFVVTR